MTQQFWFHELLAAGKGPDWIFNTTFASGRGSALSATVRANAPIGFTHYQAVQRPCPIHSRLCDYDLYIDEAHYQAYIDQLEGRAAENIYIYHTVQVCQNDYQLVRGYGGYPDQHGSAETQSIRALAETPKLAMTEWSIVYGGVTYQYEMLASGATAAELLEYLDGAD